MTERGTQPRLNDVILQGDAISGGYYLIDAVTLKQVAGPFATSAMAIDEALTTFGFSTVWQESFDNRGRTTTGLTRIAPAGHSHQASSSESSAK